MFLYYYHCVSSVDLKESSRAGRKIDLTLVRLDMELERLQADGVEGVGHGKHPVDASLLPGSNKSFQRRYGTAWVPILLVDHQVALGVDLKVSALITMSASVANGVFAKPCF